MEIGIIDDDEKETLTIIRTIKTIIYRSKNKNNNFVNITFKSYDLNSKEKINEKLINNILNDITENKISALIIDYKFVIKSNENINGANIFKEIKDVTPSFPMVLMTNYLNDSLKNDYIDSDKVYSKKEFFIIEDYAEEKTKNLLRNISNYEKLRDSASIRLKNLKTQYIKSDENENQEIVSEIIKQERELDKYLPIQQSYLEEALNIDELKDILKLIEKIKKNLE